MSKGQTDRDCTDKCKSVQHGNTITSVITKRGVSDTELCAYLRWRCCACGQVIDSMGRSALHVAASCGRVQLLNWLTKTGQINAKDYESGYTPLHRSIFYGKIDVAVSLIRLGANLNALDNNDLTPLDHAMKDRLVEYSPGLLCQAYVWGTNTNNTLGTGTLQAKLSPDLHDAFHKKFKNVSVQQVAMSKFHSIIVCKDGRVFSCGHGQGGRLGLNTENTVLIPEEVMFSNVCVEASVSLDHSVFLMDNGQVWTCGLNTHHVLGVKPPPLQLLQPRPVHGNLSDIKGVCSGRFHSVAWGVNFLYTWGLHAGQLGQDKSSNSTQITPKLVANINTEIIYVAASDGATVVATKKGDVFVLHEYQIRKIASKQLNVEKVMVVGGHLSKLNDVLSEKGGNELKVLVLRTTGNLYLWQESWPQLSRCIYSLNRPLILKDAVLSRTQLFFVSNDGEAFRGEFKTRKKKQSSPSGGGATTKSTFHEFLDKNECQMIKVHRYPNVHRAVRIHCDLKGRNFAVIQCAPQSHLINIPETSPKTIAQDMLNLLNNSEEICDAIFNISNERFPVHRYIIALKSEQLDSLIESNTGESIELTNIHPLIFKQILIYIYTGTCDVLKPGPCPCNIKGNPINLVQQAAKRFGIKCLHKKLDGFMIDLNGYIQTKTKKSFVDECKFDRLRFKNLCDVVVQSKSGEIKAHKCILSARLEYFNNLFALRWNSSQTISLPISQNVMETVIDFLYTDDFKTTEDIDHLSNVLVVSDQLFIERLKEFCEVALSGLLTLKNSAQMLQFSSTYNAKQLKRCSMEFICLNLPAILESKVLEILDDDVLKDVTQFYYMWNKIFASRVITPYSDAPSDEVVKQINENHPVNLDENPQIKTSSRKKVRVRRSSEHRTKSTEEEIEEETSNEKNVPKQLDNKWVEIISEKQKHEKTIQSRLQAIISAKEKLETETETVTEKTRISMFQEPSTSYLCDIPIQMGQKLSQKQKKLLLKDVNVIKEKEEKKPAWQEIPIIKSPIVSPKFHENFLDIITDERKQRENWSKMRTRPLIYSQMEDKAISDLERFYNIDCVSDECITIHKVVKGIVAVPFWVHKN